MERRAFLLLGFTPLAFADDSIPMRAIQSAEDMPIFAPKTAPVITGQGRLNYTCAKCHLVLIKGINQGQVNDVAIRCPRCRTLNAMP